jgi:tetratricopeptide (TPR) repeat protein
MSSSNDSTYNPNSSGSSFFDALIAKPIALVSILLAIIVIAAVYVGVRNQKEAKAQASSNALFHAQKSYESEMKAFASSVAPAETASKDKKAAAPAPSPDTVIFKKADVDAKFPETIKGYKAVIDQFPGTRASFESLLALGSLYSNHGEPAKAIDWLKKATDSAPSSADRAEAYYGLGYALEGAGKYSDAIQAYQNAINSGEPVAKADILLAVARNQELMGDKAKARETYDQIIKQSPNSDQAHTAESLKAQK